MKEVRPTTGKTLNALFNILGPLSGKSFLDLFSGTGRVAAKALERGAEIVTVELLRGRAAQIRRDLGETGHLPLCMDVRRALHWLEKRDMRFDIVFADPPYGMKWMEELPRLLEQHRSILKEGGMVIIERSRAEALELGDSAWRLCDERKYGLSVLDFLKMKENSDVQA